jgi:hypothetical protein
MPEEVLEPACIHSPETVPPSLTHVEHYGIVLNATHDGDGALIYQPATNAAAAPVVDRFLPDTFEKPPDATFVERYKNALDIQNRKDRLRSRWVRITAMALRQAEAC